MKPIYVSDYLSFFIIGKENRIMSKHNGKTLIQELHWHLLGAKQLPWQTISMS